MKKIILAAAIVSVASAWAIPGKLIMKNGGEVSGDIKWRGRDESYVVKQKNGMETERKADDVKSVVVKEPANLQRAIELVQNGNGASAIGTLTKITQEYKMLQWDKIAARYLVEAYLAANDAENAFKAAQSIISSDKKAAYSGELAPAYWQALLKLNKITQLERCLERATSSEDRGASAMALSMRGDVILAQGADQANLRRALTEAYLRVVLMYRDAPYREARKTAMLKAADCFEKLGYAARGEKLRTQAKSL